MPDASKCPVCEQTKPKNRRLCVECLEIYGNDAAEWPAWLRLLRNDTERWRYDDRQAYEHEVPLGDFDPYESMSDGWENGEDFTLTCLSERELDQHVRDRRRAARAVARYEASKKAEKESLAVPQEA